eukprot:Opistho-2@32925
MRRHVYFAYAVWIVMTCGFIFGLVTNMAHFFSGDTEWICGGNDATYFFLSLIWTITGIPLSFYFWYYRLYELHRKTGLKQPGISYWFWFFHGFINICWDLVYVIGPAPESGLGFAGFETGIKFFKFGDDNPEHKSKARLFGTLTVINASLWCIITIGSAFTLLTVYRWYRSTGGRNMTQRDVQRGIVAGASHISSSEESQPILGASRNQ